MDSDDLRPEILCTILEACGAPVLDIPLHAGRVEVVPGGARFSWEWTYVREPDGFPRIANGGFERGPGGSVIIGRIDEAAV